MKYLVNAFLAVVVCSCYDAGCMSNEELYRGDPGSSNVSTYLYLCERDVSEGYVQACERCVFPGCNNEPPEMDGRFIGAVTVDLGKSFYGNVAPSGEQVLDDLLKLNEGEITPEEEREYLSYPKIREVLEAWQKLKGGEIQPEEVPDYPRVVWSGSVLFYKSGTHSSWTNKSVVEFYPAYNEDAYVEPVGEEMGYSRSYAIGMRDEFVSKEGHWWLRDDEKNYLHSSNGDSMIQASDLNGWGGIKAIGERGIEYWRLKNPLSMMGFLTNIGQSQGHVGHIRNHGKRFAPNCYIFSNENGRGFCYSILKKFGAKSGEM